MNVARRFPVGAELTADGVHFRVWAPTRRQVEVAIQKESTHSEAYPLTAEGNGYFSGLVAGLTDRALYRFRLDGGPDTYPDPVSRFQPEGPHGPSQVVDPNRYIWRDLGWKGVSLRGQVLYEMHVGTFTKEGTWAAARRELPELAALGITCLEVMPVAEFPGKFGWGYDGVNLFATTRLYGSPDDFRQFVDTAHAHGLGVILDVVYNHLGPDGNYLEQFAPAYFTDKYETDWGKAINYDGDNSAPVREFFAMNAAFWVDEYHIDGLRLDATQNIYDDSPDHILAVITRSVREAARGRATILVAENEPQETKLVRPADRGGYGLDALWNDDFHHTALVAMTGRSEAYRSDYGGSPQELISAVKYGYLYQGQWYSWQDQRRGHPAFDLDPPAFVTFIQNHDQVANSGRGYRAHQLTSPGRYRAMTTLMLLAPGTPMLFQGQEFASSAPFLFFADHVPDLAALVAKGRVEFLQQFQSLHDPAMREVFAKPHEADTFTRCKLDFAEREIHAPLYRLTRDLLQIRRKDPVLSAQERRGLDGAVLGVQAFLLRFFAPNGHDRLLLVNLGRDLHLKSAPEPLLAPPDGTRWTLLLSTDDPKYGGHGVATVVTADEGWRVPAEAAVLFAPNTDVNGRVPAPRGRTKSKSKPGTEPV
ncbi:malto-oligosyltrehalose trehalohydrolase [Fimbriiglobus ruber]|uniref:Malto-oligosyltrehalose trehalohydrolase n=1 Tax=Fimbriiglobus ruber TaxID=1908690 RepID=A0A225CZK1_9BACT|nr:malto-oligosyltrehalose trehalohydrolase [Fimbriiglobus ruber]OWK34771.1 Malto-oligosyltrehalose trehalohydrolase [Fimbriiglobus ruber]